MRIGLLRNSLTETPGSSLATLFGTLEATARKHFEVSVPTPFYCLPRERRLAYLASFVKTCDLVVAADPLAGRLRRETGADFRLLYFPLGSLPRGGELFRLSLPFFRTGDTIAFTSRADQNVYSRLVRSCAASSVLLPLSVDTRAFRPASLESRRHFRRAYGLGEEEVLFVYAGRITAEKNVHGVLRVMRDVVGRTARARLLVVGRISDSPMVEFPENGVPLSEELARFLESERSLAERTLFLGAVRNELLPELLGAADVFVNLTLHHDENFGYSQVEAMGCGLPVVCTNWGGLRDTVLHGLTGFHVSTAVCDRGVQIDKVAAAHFCSQLAEDGALRAKMGAASREWVVSQYSREAFERNLRSLIALRRPASSRPNVLSSFGRRIQRAFPPGNTPRYRLPTTRRLNPTYRLYKGLIASYCSGPPRAVRAQDVLFIQPERYRLGRRTITVIDPIWSGKFRITANERRVFRVMERSQPGTVAFGRIAALLPAMSQSGRVAAIRALVRMGIIGTSPPQTATKWTRRMPNEILRERSA